jgi:hypothetical protein
MGGVSFYFNWFLVLLTTFNGWMQGYLNSLYEMQAKKNKNVSLNILIFFIVDCV